MPIPIYDAIGLEGFTLFVVKKDHGKNTSEVDQMNGSGNWMTDTMTEIFVETFSAKGSKIQVEYLSEAELLRIIRTGKDSARGESASAIIQESMILVRPDHAVCWHWAGDLAAIHLPRKGGELNPRSLCESVADTVIGNDVVDENNNNTSIHRQDQKKRDKQGASYQKWLTAQFLHNLRPFMFNFPNAVPITNNFKESAVERVKNSIRQKARKKDGVDASSSSAVAFKNEYDVSTANISSETSKNFVMGAAFGHTSPKEGEELSA
jgi:hypothetical protein